MPLSDIDKVRLLIGDTDAADLTLTDAQVQFFLDEAAGAFRAAAITAADAAANVLAMRAVSETTGGMSVDYSRRAEAFRQRSIDLAVGVSAIAGCYVGGISQSELDEERAAEPPRAFTVGQHDEES